MNHFFRGKKFAMMILRSTPARIRPGAHAASLLGIADEIDVRPTDLNDPAD
jgi:hypothetical protein